VVDTATERARAFAPGLALVAVIVVNTGLLRPSPAPGYSLRVAQRPDPVRRHRSGKAQRQLGHHELVHRMRAPLDMSALPEGFSEDELRFVPDPRAAAV
jgi:hypothetical protein